MKHGIFIRCASASFPDYAIRQWMLCSGKPAQAQTPTSFPFLPLRRSSLPSLSFSLSPDSSLPSLPLSILRRLTPRPILLLGVCGNMAATVPSSLMAISMSPCTAAIGLLAPVEIGGALCEADGWRCGRLTGRVGTKGTDGIELGRSCRYRSGLRLILPLLVARANPPGPAVGLDPGVLTDVARWAGVGCRDDVSRVKGVEPCTKVRSGST